MKTFTLENNLELIMVTGLDIVILYYSIDLLNQITNKTEKIQDLDTLRYIIYITLGIQIFGLIFNHFFMKKNTTLLILDFIDLILKISYIIILEDFNKSKNYDKSAKYAKILIGLASSSILLGLIFVYTLAQIREQQLQKHLSIFIQHARKYNNKT